MSLEITKLVTIGSMLHVETKIKDKEKRFYIWKDERGVNSEERKVISEAKKMIPEFFI